MKKLFTTILIIIISQISAFAGSIFAESNQPQIALGVKQIPIEDDLVKSSAFPKILPVYEKVKTPITDDFIEEYNQSYTNSEKTLKLWARKNGEKSVEIEDELTNNPSFLAKFGNKPSLKNQAKIEDNLIKKFNLSEKAIVKAKNCYDFSKKQIPVKLKVVRKISTKHKISEGDTILFKTIEDVSITEKKLPKGTKIVGRIETISESDKMGTPANIIVDNFYVEDNPDICFYGNIARTGANRSIWVYPLYQAGNIMFYVAGFVFVPIHGGHAKLNENDTYTVFYETK